MHMGNELMSPAVGAGLAAVAAGGLAFAIAKARPEMDDRKIPLMGVMGAFVFAAQMMNFPILPGTSGHLGGGALLAIALGPHLACICMASILIIQCLIFQDGGLMALGANIINMAIIGSYLGYAVYRVAAFAVRGKLSGPAAAFAAAWVAVVAGSVAVPIETALAGRLAVPFGSFVVAMVGIHVVIGLVEGAITVATLAYVHAIRPEAVRWELLRSGGLPLRYAAVSVLIVALLLAGVFSFYASGQPDGLEKAIEPWQPEREAGEGPFAPLIAASERLAVFPDYGLLSEKDQEDKSRLSQGLAGAAGTVITLGVVFLLARIVRARRPSAS